MSNKSLDGVLTKKAHTREKFSEEQIQDLVECSNAKTGFEYFAKKFFYIQHPVEGCVKCVYGMAALVVICPNGMLQDIDLSNNVINVGIKVSTKNVSECSI